MNSGGPQFSSWQMMYNRLINDYSTLSYSYHQQAEHNFLLYQQLQTVLQQKITLLQAVNAPTLPQILQSSHHQQEEASSPSQKMQMRKKRNHRQRIRRNAKVYSCTYPDCHLTYRSAVSMNLHIKRKHKGGSKKERQAFAKMVIDAENQGISPPQNNIILPPGFLQEFKKNYSYIKKYNM